ncbi:ISNCY family transposase [Methylobacter psychrophilus]|uniref:ISNCY family transposase n=1 Tax=Methylobacter psychrophilus TaxID=96941 RepID=UPI0021D4AF2F|nr:ISNCY family transposase [Methylobacter psychrophilus]
MSAPFGLNALTFSDVVKQLHTTFETFSDPRTGKNTNYTMTDAGLSAFSVFFMQSPSFLDFQRTMQDTQGKNNAQTLFGVFKIPTDNHIRSLLDAVEPATVYPLFDFVFDGLQRAGVIDTFRSTDNRLLLALDGTDYFSSQNLHGPCCSSKTHRNGKVSYSHKVITPVLVKSGSDKVISLAPEFVRPQDGHEKQDCEINASLRWLESRGSQYAALGTTVLGDDLYCHEPFCRALLVKGLEFTLVCKPDSHKTLYEWVDDLGRNGIVKTLVQTRWTGKRHETDTYRYVSSVPLRDADDALMVNWCEITTRTADGKVRYRNAFATSLRIDDANVVEIVASGRARWKIENENNNTLKTKGYRFEHNFGHGQQFLSSLLATLILLAYLLHTLLDLMDDKFCLLRQKLPSRKRLFDDMKALTTYFCFDNWEHLLDFMLEGWSYKPGSPINRPPKPEIG